MNENRIRHTDSREFAERALNAAAGAGEGGHGRMTARAGFTGAVLTSLAAAPGRRKTGGRAALLIGASALTVATAIAGITQFTNQNLIRINAARGPSCGNCTIDLKLVASLGKSSDSVAHDFYPTVEAGPGLFYVTGIGRFTVLVYDSTGKLLRTLGRRGGEGPGEFAQITRVFRGDMDSLLVADVLKISVFSPPPALEFVRSAPIHLGIGIGFAHGLVSLPSGSMVLSTSGTLQEQTRPVRIIRPDGGYSQAFGGPPAPVAGCYPCSLRPLARSQIPAQFWVVVPNRYHLQLVDTLGNERRRIEVVGSSWFTPYESFAQPPIPATEYVKPPTQVVGASVQRDGRIWTISHAAADNWSGGPLAPRRPVPPAPAGRGGGAQTNLVPPDSGAIRRRATIIELLDPVSARVVASRRFDGQVLTPMSDGMVFSIREDKDGEAVVNVWRITLMPGR